MTPSDEMNVLRFASGEMERDDENLFLARCELDPALYRETTLAIAEHRRVILALREFVTDAELGADATQIATREKEQNLATAWNWIRIPATLAAGLLIGMLVTSWSVHEPHSHTAKEKMEPSVGSSQVVSKIDSPAVTIADSQLNESALGQLASLLRMEPLIPEDEAEILKNHGFVVEESPALYVIDDAQGKRWAVPTNHATLRYVKQ